MISMPVVEQVHCLAFLSIALLKIGSIGKYMALVNIKPKKYVNRLVCIYDSELSARLI